MIGQLWRRVNQIARRGRGFARNQLATRGFAARSAVNGAIPDGAIVLFFGTTPDNIYQFEQWRRPLEQLAATPGLPGVGVVVHRADTGDAVLARTSLPVVLAAQSADLERLVAERSVSLVLYVNHVEPNFRMLRYGAPVHVQLGHGESDKGTSVSNQHKAYDLVFVGGQAGHDRLARALRGFDADRHVRTIGRPQLDHRSSGAPGWSDAGHTGRVVFYAPTWEGDRPSIAYGSLVSHGEALIEALRADPTLRIVYRPHPRTGLSSPAHAAADARIRELLAADGDRHLVDTGEYGWQWSVADACITDVGSVAYDWLATGKPLVVTQPVEPRAYLTGALTDQLTLLPADQAGTVVDRLAELWVGGAELASLGDYYFGDTADGASSRRFEAAIREALEFGRTGG